MKRLVLILGTNAGQADIIDYFIKEDWIVHTCGIDPSSIGAKLSNKFHHKDFSNMVALRRLVEKLKPDLVYSVSSDLAVNASTLISIEKNLPFLLSELLIERYDKKQKLRQWLNENSISEVKFECVDSQYDHKKWSVFPCIVKPTNSQGQRGLSIVNSKKYLKGAIDYACRNSKCNEAIIEEYLDGVEASSHVVVQNGEILLNELSERYVHNLPHIGIPKGHAIPIRNVNDTDIHLASNLIEEFVNAQNIDKGILYIQFKFTQMGPKIIEVAPRLDGCHIWRMFKYARGYDLREVVVDLLLGNEVRIEPTDLTPYELRFIQEVPGRPFNISTDLDNVTYKEFRYRTGEIVQPINGKLDVAGYYIKKG